MITTASNTLVQTCFMTANIVRLPNKKSLYRYGFINKSMKRVCQMSNVTLIPTDRDEALRK